MVEQFFHNALYKEIETGMKFTYSITKDLLENKKTGTVKNPIKSKFRRVNNYNYSIGQIVTIKSIEEMTKYHREVNSDTILVPAHFTNQMRQLCGKSFKIAEVYYIEQNFSSVKDIRYHLEDLPYSFSNEMLEVVNPVRRF